MPARPSAGKGTTATSSHSFTASQLSAQRQEHAWSRPGCAKGSRSSPPAAPRAHAGARRFSQPAARSAPADDVETDDDVIVEEMLAALHDTQARQLLDHSMSAPEILAGLVAADPVAFVRHVLPVIREAATASRTGRILDDGEQDEAFGFRPPQPAEHDPALLGRVAQAVRAAAGAGDSFTHTAITEMSSSPLAAEQALAAAGLHPGTRTFWTAQSHGS